MTSRRFLAVPLALGLASAALAQRPSDQPKDHTATAQAVSQPTAAGEARRVVRDPVTGLLRAPTEQEIAADNARTGRTGPGAPLSVRHHPSGMKSAVLGPDYMSTLLAERRADGTIALRHGRTSDEHGKTTTKAARSAATE